MIKKIQPYYLAIQFEGTEGCKKQKEVEKAAYKPDKSLKHCIICKS
jgi:hypothetical protein